MSYMFVYSLSYTHEAYNIRSISVLFVLNQLGKIEEMDEEVRWWRAEIQARGGNNEGEGQTQKQKESERERERYSESDPE